MKKKLIKKLLFSKGYISIETIMVGGLLISGGALLMSRFVHTSRHVEVQTIKSLNASETIVDDGLGNTYTNIRKTDNSQANNSSNKNTNIVTLFTDSKYFTYKDLGNNEIQLTNYSNAGPKEVIIPNKIDGKTVVSIGSEAFYDRGLISVTIPNTVKNIEGTINAQSVENNKGAFAKNNLSEINLPNSIENIGISAFYGNNLLKVDFGSNVKKIDDYAFSNNQLTNVIVPNKATVSYLSFNKNVSVDKMTPYEYKDVTGGVEITNYLNHQKDLTIPDKIDGKDVVSISGDAFANKGLTSIKLPNTLKQIENSANTDNKVGAFSGNKLISITIPDNVTEIGSYAFYNNKITNITFGKNTETINDYAFSNNNISKLDIPNSVKTIKQFAFNNNDKLNKVVVPDKTDVDESAFGSDVIVNKEHPFEYEAVNGGVKIVNYNGNETDLNIPSTIDGKTVVSIGNKAFMNKNLTSVVIPNTVTTIESGSSQNGAFYGNKLTSVIIPDNVTEIGSYAFYKNSINTLTLGKGIKDIGDYAFAYNNLMDLTFPDSLASIKNNAFLQNKLIKIDISKNVNVDNSAFDTFVTVTKK